jgi:signal-transduction protein with cAMP-binding, CBS, and nucleotidyltransferase domain
MRKVSEVMTGAPLVTADGATLVSRAAHLLAERAVSHLLVVEDGRLVGVVCACDLDRARALLPIAAVMSRPRTVDVEATTFEAAGTMLREGIGCLPVLAAGALAGIVTRSDLCRAGVLEQTPQHCAACGSRDHVRSIRRGAPVGFCLECDRRSEPPSPDEDIGGDG